MYTVYILYTAYAYMHFVIFYFAVFFLEVNCEVNTSSSDYNHFFVVFYV